MVKNNESYNLMTALSYHPSNQMKNIIIYFFYVLFVFILEMAAKNNDKRTKRIFCICPRSYEKASRFLSFIILAVGIKRAKKGAE